ncbi:MAG: D-glycerate dehydrogenase [Chloroflexota bacterium]
MTVRPRVFIARQIPDIGMKLILDACDPVVWPEDMPPPREALLEAVAGCDGVLTMLTDRVDDGFLDAAGAPLRVVSNMAVGYDNIDVPACTRRGVAVGITPGVLTETTADLTWALILAAARRLPEGERFVHSGDWRTWSPMYQLGVDIHGATLGIIGFGRIGQAVARRAQGFGMPILYASRNRANPDVEAPLNATWAPLEELLARSDVVSVHVDLNPSTLRLIDAAALARMKPGAILVNTTRGPVVDPTALFEALRDGLIRAAALDVTDPEPIPADDPLLTLDNCLIVPHIGSATEATRGKMATMAAANLVAGLRGERLPTPVNPEVFGLDWGP